jgi:hydrogenase maturation protease
VILIIGYGNPLRSDDAIGQQLALALQTRLPHLPLQVQTCYQLVPELVSLVSQAQQVVFIDARVDGTPGDLFHQLVIPDVSAGAFTHHVTPGSLLAAAHELYGKAPSGILISITGASFGYGGGLSPELQQKLPALTAQVKAIIESSAQFQLEKENEHA